MILRKMSASALAVAAILAVQPAHAESSRDEKVGTSCADCPSYNGAFSITNETGALIHYQVRWGNHHEWKRIDLATGHVETHRYPLGDNAAAKVPTPFVRFDNLADGKRTTFQEYRMQFYAVGYAGYGPNVNRTTPKRYHFRYAGDGRHLDLKAD